MIETLTAEQVKLQKRLHKNVWKAIDDYKLIEDGDKVMVCLSGGKDSYTMLDILLHIQHTKKYDFEIIAVNLDQKQPGFPEHILPEYLDKLGVDYKILNKDTYSIVTEKLGEGKTMCSLCSRLRRGTLYTAAEELGVTKIALGHHRDDIIETFLLNMFFSGKLEAMPPIYKTDDQKHVVIRPLAYCKEKDIEVFSELKEFPIIPCNLCGSQPKLQRQMVKNMLKEWEKDYPDRSEVIFNSLKNTSPSHLLDRDLYDYQNFKMIEPPIKS
ncbi:tRNA 2-thiocytidine(32) synthetase TtcA [Flammeovirga sp. SubArs3]|uniref:tRNA 2-thiocytidine(32) synthetase TtcA n=1 Tax=Flammeovirga sp. SubArs3 TaxID=2995316 RepID=UPI00248C2029|nr:tRNA 2-thiocytidine(32) synthetase TtcA [Flammeovirga sp. SubArs3]